ncbi:MAG: hypothetical protein WA989_05015, partial [Henriciella sp.]
NTRNFAPPGNIVAGVPSGTGVIIMANDRVEVTGNTFDDNQTVQILVTAYTEEFTDEDYNPLPRNVYIHGNDYGTGGNNPQGDLAQFAALLGGSLPAIVWDGVTRWDGADDADVSLAIDEPEEVGFINLGLGTYPIELSRVSPSTERPTGDSFGGLSPVSLSHTE